MINKKGQVSIELIILVGMLIIGAIVLSVTLISTYNKNIATTDDTAKKQTDLVDNFVDDLDDVQSETSGNQASEFIITFQRPVSNPPYSAGNIPFRITYSGEVGPVICTWNLTPESSPFIIPPFNGCSTSRNLAVGRYNVSYSVTDGTSTLTGNSSFRVQ